MLSRLLFITCFDEDQCTILFLENLENVTVQSERVYVEVQRPILLGV